MLSLISFARYCEFGHSVLERLLDSSTARPPLYYMGCLREDQRDVSAALEAKVYKHWDSSSAAPARTRPSETTIAEPTLELLGWVNGAPHFPEVLLQKFPQGSAAFMEVQSMQQSLQQEFPNASTSGTQGSQRTPRARAVGRPDFSIDGGAQPLDSTRQVQLEHIAEGAFTVERTSFQASWILAWI